VRHVPVSAVLAITVDHPGPAQQDRRLQRPTCRGLRRGEYCGLRWATVDLDRGLLFVKRQRTTAGDETVEGGPKTAEAEDG
jgi:integrase